jgi:mRNA interferase MazF
VIERGSVHWADLGAPIGSRPAKRRPVLVIQAERFNRSRLGSVVIAGMTSNLELARFPGNVVVPADSCGLARESVVKVTALQTMDRDELEPAVGVVPLYLMRQVDDGLRLVLGLGPH